MAEREGLKFGGKGGGIELACLTWNQHDIGAASLKLKGKIIKAFDAVAGVIVDRRVDE
jgi:hypothetical protein